MAGYRFQVDMTMCFTIAADSVEAAEASAREFVDTFENGATVGPNVGDFSDADAKVYSNSPDLELIDVDEDYRHDDQA